MAKLVELPDTLDIPAGMLPPEKRVEKENEKRKKK